MAHHSHIRLAYLILVAILAVSGFMLFKPANNGQQEVGLAFLSSGQGPPGHQVNAYLFPNISTIVNLTINGPTKGLRLKIDGKAQDLIVGIGNKTLLASNGFEDGTIFRANRVSKTFLDPTDAPFIDSNGNGIADDYETRHKLTAKQSTGDPDSDNLTTIQEYLYYSKTGREINPLDIDTDLDFSGDGTEVHIGTDPIDSADTPLFSFAEEPWYFAQNDLQANPALTTHWTFDTHNMRDTHGENTLTLFNGSSIQDDFFDMGLWLPKGARGARAGTPAHMEKAQDFTMSAWVQTNDNRSRTILELVGPDNGPAIVMDFASSRPQCKLYTGGKSYTAGIKLWRIFSDGTPHQIACRRQGNTLALFIDGKEEASSRAPDETIRTIGTMFIGTANGTQNPFMGMIDEVSIYNTSLTDQDINNSFTTMYNGIDQDHDNMADSWETRFGLSPQTPEDATRDDDHEGLVNLDEFRYFLLSGHTMDPKLPDTDADTYSDLAEQKAGTVPSDPKDRPGYKKNWNRDTDGDGIPDWWALGFGLAIYRNITDEDPDKDGLSNLQEYSYFTRTGRMISPIDADTNHDGTDDLTEIEKRMDPSSDWRQELEIDLPGRFRTELPRGANIEYASIDLDGTEDMVLYNQQERKKFLGKGRVDIKGLINSDCQTAFCRNVIVIEQSQANQTKARLSAPDIRYTLLSDLPSPMPICADYPCTFFIGLKSASPGNLTLRLDAGESCDVECQQKAMACPSQIACQVPSRKISVAPNPFESIRLAAFVLLGAGGIGLVFSLIFAAGRLRKKKPAPKGREQFVSEARTFMLHHAKQGKSLESSAETLINSGWPQAYVHEAMEKAREDLKKGR